MEINTEAQRHRGDTLSVDKIKPLCLRVSVLKKLVVNVKHAVACVLLTIPTKADADGLPKTVHARHVCITHVRQVHFQPQRISLRGSKGRLIKPTMLQRPVRPPSVRASFDEKVRPGVDGAARVIHQRQGHRRHILGVMRVRQHHVNDFRPCRGVFHRDAVRIRGGGHRCSLPIDAGKEHHGKNDGQEEECAFHKVQINNVPHLKHLKLS